MKRKPGCAASGCIGSVMGGFCGGLATIILFVWLIVSSPTDDVGGPLLWPIAGLILSVVGAIIGGLLGAIVGFILSSRAKKPDEDEPPIAKP